MPQYPGGWRKMLDYIRKNIQLPSEYFWGNVMGWPRTVVEFVVESDGSLSNVEVARSWDFVCDKEAVRIVKSMPKWIPGKHNGKNVRIHFVVIVSYSHLCY